MHSGGDERVDHDKFSTAPTSLVATASSTSVTCTIVSKPAVDEEDEDDEDDDIERENIEVGFAAEPENRNYLLPMYFPSKVGGRPVSTEFFACAIEIYNLSLECGYQHQESFLSFAVLAQSPALTMCSRSDLYHMWKNAPISPPSGLLYIL
jgi:hypothetical protein